jgi:glycosyltransferase involved in cell wall biosynthesis
MEFGSSARADAELLADAEQTVDVLLATYNGATYLPAQLASLEAQTHRQWRLLARDDGSTDGTVDILRSWGKRNPGRLDFVEDGERRLGPALNFGRLLQASTADYVAFCDQDDVWRPSRLARTVLLARQLEAQHGTDTPILVHSDLVVVDENLRVVAESFWKHQFLDVRNENRLERLLVQNVVTGCSTLVNRALWRRATPIPPGVVMHDWWLTLVAAAFGVVSHVDEALIDYRQHGANDTGAKAWNFRFVGQQLMRTVAHRTTHIRVVQTQVQAQALLETFLHELDATKLQIVSDYAGMNELNPVLKRVMLLKNGYRKTGLVRNVGLFLSV